ncbi:MAG: 4Fe-4S dicluster domain-containing protein [Dehalococcoidia bacterium]|nr:4Fe-4S dicluster domain-containing protein [Dehalococcoidia bacterium]
MARSASKKKAKVTIREQWCKGCRICVEMCPLKVLSLNENKKAYVQNDVCNGCRLCERLCPDFAIDIGEKDDASEQGTPDSGK